MQQLRPYTPDIELMMQIFYQSLSEKERRRYAAIEALKIGYGGISYIERLLGTNCRTIKRGIEELKSRELMSQRGIRAQGGGRKRKLETIEGLESAFEGVIDRHIAGDPMDEEIRWTHLTRQQIADLLWSEEDIRVSVTVIDQLLDKQKFRRRQAFKTKATGNNPARNEQFEKINQLIEDYQKAGNPVMSVDPQKKKSSVNSLRSSSEFRVQSSEFRVQSTCGELSAFVSCLEGGLYLYQTVFVLKDEACTLILNSEFRIQNSKGQLYRAGKTYNQQPIEVYDHDWPSLATLRGNSSRSL